MSTGSLTAEQVDPALFSSFRERPDHSTLGAEFGITPVETADPFELPIGTKLFVVSKDKKDDPHYDSLGIVVGSTDEGLQIVTAFRKDGKPWQVHDAYGRDNLVSDLEDLSASFDRIFNPVREAGSVAVLSEITNSLMTPVLAETVGQAGCNSHEKDKSNYTLRSSQLLDRFSLGGALLFPDSELIRRNEHKIPLRYLPGKQLPGQPSVEARDQLSQVDRLDVLSKRDNSRVRGASPGSILSGLEHVVNRGMLGDSSRPIDDIAKVIMMRATRRVF